jgi:hypothetical protein
MGHHLENRNGKTRLGFLPGREVIKEVKMSVKIDMSLNAEFVIASN